MPTANDIPGQTINGRNIRTVAVPGNGTGDNRDSRINEPWTDNRLKTWVSNTFPNLSEYLIVPEIRALMVTAGQQEWSDDKITAALAKTKYFTSLANTKAVPSGGGRGGGGRGGGGGGGQSQAAKDNQLASVMSMLNDKAKTYGLSLNNDQLKWIAQSGIDADYIESQYNDALLDMVKVVGADISDTGTVKVDRSQMQQMARSYLTTLSDSTLDQYAMAIERGEMSIDGVKLVLQAQAKARFGYLGQMIDGGITPEQYFAPTRDMIARTLELPPESVDLMDPKWVNLVEVPDDKAPGGMRAATLSEAMKAARKRPEWAMTENAQDQAANWTTSLVKAFGG